MIKHYFFDLDNTIARSKSQVAPEHIPILQKLASKYDVTIVSGQSSKLIADHATDALKGMYYTLGQNGNEARARDGSLIWFHPLTDEQRAAIEIFIKKVREHTTVPVVDENDLVEDRGCQIAYSLIGHNRPIEEKEAFDPDFHIRQRLMMDLSAEVLLLRKAQVEVRIAGTTVLDIFALGKNKGYNIHEFIKQMHWPTDECIYIGDALMPGGNDETVIGIIPTHAVKDYHETYEYLKGVLGM